jgi:nucleoside-diphosphate-sugar epimerase
MPHLFIFGLGSIGSTLARTALAQGWTVAGTCRDPAKREALRAEEIEAHLFDRDRPLADIEGLLGRATHLLIATPGDGRGDPVMEVHGPAIVKARHLSWIGALSGASLYGDRGGGWASEDSAIVATNSKLKARVKQELGWRALWQRERLPVHLFRLGGVYGPGRSALDRIKAGAMERIEKPGHVFHWVHVDDVVQTLLASMARPEPGRVYNVADDEAISVSELVQLACETLGVEPPPPLPFDQAKLSPMAAIMFADNRRVSNARIKQELGVALRYPHMRDGLRAIAAATVVK